jgi:hypothetical protein
MLGLFTRPSALFLLLVSDQLFDGFLNQETGTSKLIRLAAQMGIG